MNCRRFTHPTLLFFVWFFFVIQFAHAGSGTWILNPINNDFNTAANWSSNTVPGLLDTATFAVSNRTDVSLSEASSVFEIVFQTGASAYQITAPGILALGVGNGGIENESGIVQNFVAKRDDTGNGGLIACVGLTQGPLVFTAEARGVAEAFAGEVLYDLKGSAGEAVFINEGGIVSGTTGGETDFFNSAKAETATVTNQPGTVSGASGGLTMFWMTSNAERAVITCEGASIAGATGGITSFVDDSHGGNATLIAQGGTGGAGGTIQFHNNTDALKTRVEVFDDGSLDMSDHASPGMTIGSVEGDGVVFLGGHQLMVGNNDLSTTFSGVAQDGGSAGGLGGSLNKIGTGTLILSNANTYTGGTIVTAGALEVRNDAGSATGTGPVTVSAGTLGGRGIIAGAVTVGTGSGAGAFLSPSKGARHPATLTLQSSLTFKSDSSYNYKLSTRRAKADQVIANGVTIENGAQFNFHAAANKKLHSGQVFTALSNTSANLISGIFSNLPDDSTFTVGNNTFQADYQGGDGNDLTLTVVL
jgi:autotransporter-associated beta strand protein